MNGNNSFENEQNNNDIAIIAMSGRFPGADSVEAFWNNLKSGIESVSFFNYEQLKTMGIDEHLLDNPKFVAADAVLNDIDLFDARFFNMSPREAEITDPQHRLFLESAWELMERAGYAPQKYHGRVGVYAGSALSGYMMRNLKSNTGLIEQVGTFKTMLANDKDFLSTKVSYQMGFTGPSINVNTLCSSSAVAIHLACEALLNYQCDIAMAGGVSIQVTRNESFFYQEGKIGSPDGHCRAFDERAAGTVSGSGLGLVALKRLTEAEADRDNILAIIKGTAINNDGNQKASYTAPSSDGQAEVITEALELAGVDARTVTYIEAHGTGTHLGDPIEITGLTKAFAQHTDDKQFCAVGSVKTNIGHLVTAGGVASVIKTVLALQNKQIPASLNFERPNPKIDFDNSPFFVNTELRDWQGYEDYPLRAGVSSFGIGGTNAHIILEQASDRPATPQVHSCYLIPLSAKTATALETMRENLLQHLRESSSQFSLSDVAYTLQLGRNDFEYRSVMVASDYPTLFTQLQGENFDGCYQGQQKDTERSVVFMFPGQGSQYHGMGAQLYLEEPCFREHFDHCCELIKLHSDLDIKDCIFNQDQEQGNALLKNTALTQPALFAIEYALAKLWQHFGVYPESMIGHSIGEIVAACLSGVFSLEDAVKIVVSRGAIMNQMPVGAMLSVSLGAEEVTELLNDELWLAAENSSHLCVLSGTETAICNVEAVLTSRNIKCRRIQTSHAFHSGLMDAALPKFRQTLQSITFGKVSTPFISNVTGDWITQNQACSVEYWLNHLRQPVKFASGIGTLAGDANRILLEVGPGTVLSQLVRQSKVYSLKAINCLPAANSLASEYMTLLQALAQLWLKGVSPDWQKVHDGDSPSRVVLPTYPFERKRYWIEERHSHSHDVTPDLELHSTEDLRQIDDESLVTEATIQLKIKWNSDSADAVAQKQELKDLLALQQQIDLLCRTHNEKHASQAKLSPLGVLLLGSSRQTYQVNEQFSSREHIDTPYIEAKTPLQQQLLNHWQDILGIKPIGVHDNFFALGGNSLLAASLAVKLRSELGMEIPLAELLELPTVAHLSDLIETKQWIAADGRDGESAEELEEGSL